LCVNLFVQHLNPILERQKTESFAHKIKQSSINRAYTINDIDLMSGQEFEQFLAILFSKMGYETEGTKGSGDQGIDVIASKDGNKIGIQAKCYSGSVGNGAIQEAVAGRNYYHLDKAIVVTNAGFTNSAKELAEANSVVLWDRTILKDKITELW
jgi:HJR/Mrr/RecB family endonuclease